MRRMDVLKEYKGIDAVKDWLSGLSIQVLLAGVGQLLANSCTNPVAKIAYKVAGAISGAALSKGFYGNVSSYLTKKITERMDKKSGFDEDKFDDDYFDEDVDEDWLKEVILNEHY